MKGQYFSFDAIIATVIMVIAFITLVAYWLGAQSIIDSRANNTYADAIRVADSLFAPGSPSNWGDSSVPLANIQQIGLSNNFDNQFNLTKVKRLSILANPLGTLTTQSNYPAIANLFRVNNFYILIESTDGQPIYSTFTTIQIGSNNFVSAREISVANRGATINGKAVRMRVYVFTT